MKPENEFNHTRRFAANSFQYTAPGFGLLQVKIKRKAERACVNYDIVRYTDV